MRRWNRVAAEGIVPLYGAPSCEVPIEDEILCGMRAEVRTECPGWEYVWTEYGFEGYVPEGWLARPAVAWVRAPKRQVKALFADVLVGPGVKTGLLANLPRGARVGLDLEVRTVQPGWCAVILPDGRRGYMQESRLASLYDGWHFTEKKLRECVMQMAMSYLGVSYRWGGKTPLGIDCSGLTFMSYWFYGVGIYRNAQIRKGFPVRPIPLDQAKPGDLLYFPGHVAMLLADGEYIHATGRAGSDGVVINSLRPESERYREDLRTILLTAGTIF